MLYSEFTLKTTGCGLPAGPFGLVGAAEGISYLAIIGIAGASLATKAKTGSGLPAGPAGLLGAAEGLAFLAIVAGRVAFNQSPRGRRGLDGGDAAAATRVVRETCASARSTPAASPRPAFASTQVSGFAVLGFQLADYGYIPNAVPIEGGVCS